MARFRFRRRRFGRRRFYRRRRYGRKQRVINASSRSRCRVKVRAERFLEFQVVSGDFNGGVLCINPLIEQNQNSAVVGAIPAPQFTSLINTRIFQYYKLLYEEFKLDYMKVNIMGITPVGATAQLEGITFTTCWDRRMIPMEFNDTNFPNPQYIVDSPSSQQITCINNSVIKFKRMIRPSDLLEKLAWYPVDTKRGTLPMKGPMNVSCTALDFYVDGGLNNPIAFCPAFFMVMNTPTTPGQGTTYQYKFRVEVTYYVTFRNPRFGQASTTTRGLPPAPDAPSDDDGGMDDGAGNNDALRHVRFAPDDSDDSDDDNFTRHDANETAASDEEPPQENAGAATAAAATAALPRDVDMTGEPVLLPSKRADVQDLELEEHYAELGIPERHRQHADRDQIEYEGAEFLNNLEREMDRGVGKEHHWAVPERLQPLFMVVRDWLARRDRLIQAGVSGDIATQQAYYDIKDRWPDNIPRGLAQRLANFFINRALLYRKNYDTDAVRYISPRGTFIRSMEDQISESLYASLLRSQREQHYLPPALRRPSSYKAAPPPWKQRKR